MVSLTFASLIFVKEEAASANQLLVSLLLGSLCSGQTEGGLASLASDGQKYNWRDVENRAESVQLSLAAALADCGRGSAASLLTLG